MGYYLKRCKVRTKIFSLVNTTWVVFRLNIYLIIFSIDCSFTLISVEENNSLKYN